MGELAKELKPIVDDAFAEIGFRRKREIYYRDLGNDVLGSIGLNRSIQAEEGALSLNPVVGICYGPIERRKSLVEGSVFDRYASVTLSSSIGYLMPEKTFIQYRADSDTDLNALAHKLATDIQDYGLPFMARMVNLQDLCAVLQGWKNSIGWEQSFPIGLYLLGERGKAIEFIRHELQRFRTSEIRKKQSTTMSSMSDRQRVEYHVVSGRDFAISYYSRLEQAIASGKL